MLWLQHGIESLVEELFSAKGVGGLDPWCVDGEDVYCGGVSNLAGLIAWGAGLLLWLSSIERVRRSHYLRFIQFHQLHYVFFAFAAAHWGTCVVYIMPSAIFYAADLLLRAHGTHACPLATIRAHTHGASHGAQMHRDRLQPLCNPACSPMQSSLQPHAIQAAAPRNPM